MNKELLRALGFNEEVDAVENSRCPFCGTSVHPEDFVDALSYKEWTISGLCSRCQDEVFGG